MKRVLFALFTAPVFAISLSAQQMDHSNMPGMHHDTVAPPANSSAQRGIDSLRNSAAQQ